MPETRPQYCVLHPRRDMDEHRGPYDTREEAEAWIKEAEDDGFPKGVFVVGVREISDWRIDG